MPLAATVRIFSARPDRGDAELLVIGYLRREALAGAVGWLDRLVGLGTKPICAGCAGRRRWLFTWPRH